MIKLFRKNLYKLKWLVQKWYSSISYSTGNLIYWIPKIYNLGDWDYYYFEKVIIYQLDRMIPTFSEFNAFCDYFHNREEQQIKLVRKLLDRVNTGYYHSELDAYYGVDYDLNQAGILTESVIFDNIGAYFDKHPRTYREVVYDLVRQGRDLNEVDRYLIASYMSDKLTNRARMIAYKIIAIHSPSWWV